jgi:hypothetical protein
MRRETRSGFGRLIDSKLVAETHHTACFACHSARVMSMASFLRVTYRDDQVLNGACAARHYRLAKIAEA